MADSPLHAKVDLPTFSILVDGKEINQAYQVKSISVDKEVNQISEARILFADGEPKDETFEISEGKDLEPGKEIKIKLGYHSTEEDIFSGVITSQKIKVRTYSHQGTSELEIHCYDKAFKMLTARKSATFKDLKDSEVMAKVVKDAGLTATVKATTFKFPMMVQYDSSDWNFVLTRADANGFIVLNDAGALDIGPPTMSGTEVLDLNYGNDVIDFEGELDSTTQLDSAAGESWDSQKHSMLKGASKEPTMNAQGNITGKKLSEVGGKAKLEFKSSAPEPKEELESLASSIVQRSRFARLRGLVSFPGSSKAEVGKLVKLSGFGERFNGLIYVTRVSHELSNGFWKTEIGFGLDSKAFADSGEISGPMANGVIPGVSGVQIGKVEKIHEDPDSQFRVLVSVPSMNIEAAEGVWARLLVPHASAGVGMYFFPEIGDEVLLGFLNNDPRYAVILGSMYSAKNAAPFTPEQENKDKAIITKAKLKITFEDKDKIICVETPGGQKVTLDDKAKSLTLEDQNKNKVVLDSKGISLNSGKDIILDSKGKVAISAAQNIEIKSKGGDVAVEGLNVKSKAKVALSAEGSATAELKASGNVTVKGAMVMIN